MERKSTDKNIAAKEELGRRIDEMNKRLGRDVHKVEDTKSRTSNSAGFGNAFKLSSEFISAILVGTLIGYGIDWFFGIAPWAMIVFLMLGFVAGVMNVLRASGEMSGSYELSGDESKRPERDES